MVINGTSFSNESKRYIEGYQRKLGSMYFILYYENYQPALQPALENSPALLFPTVLAAAAFGSKLNTYYVQLKKPATIRLV